ncbi:MAG TPA: ComF family protein [candidate division Zixibacteria bacterium]|nr:ComF family protein [candidate division Zixibacteria bacterium]
MMSLFMGIAGAIGGFGKTILDIVFPAGCAICGMRTMGEPACGDCLTTVETDMRAFCPNCRAEIGASGGCPACSSGEGYFNMSVFQFRDSIRELILMMKYSSRIDIGHYLGLLMATRLGEDFAIGTDAILPVPLHPVKKRSRGYNQSELIATALGSELGVLVDIRSVRRTRNTQTQTKLGFAERKDNVAGAFIATRDLTGKSFIILDDVITTGATTREVARAIISAGGTVKCSLAVATPAIEESKQHGI